MNDETIGYRKWTYKNYMLLAVQPVEPGTYFAVFCDNRDQTKPMTLFVCGVDAIGVAAETQITMERCPPMKYGREISRDDPMNLVVGLELVDGYHDIVNEADNFCGLMRKGGDPRKMHGCSCIHSDRFKNAVVESGDAKDD